jgi:hypothetical protein
MSCYKVTSELSLIKESIMLSIVIRRYEYLVKPIKILLVGLILRMVLLPKGHFLNNIVQGYSNLWKGHLELIKKHLIIDAFNDAVFDNLFSFWMKFGFGSKVKVQSCCSEKPVEIINFALKKRGTTIKKIANIVPIFSILGMPLFIPHYLTKQHLYLNSVKFLEVFAHHAADKCIAILVYPIVFAIEEDVSHFWNYSKSTIYNNIKEVAKYIAINPFEGIYMLDYFGGSNIITNAFTQNDIEIRKTDLNYSIFMDKINEDWMEAKVDALIHSKHYYQAIHDNWNVLIEKPVISITKATIWTLLITGLKFNTDDKQEIISDSIYKKEEIFEPNYLDQDVTANYLLGETFYCPYHDLSTMLTSA